MKRANSIFRTKTIFQNEISESYNVELMTFEKYLNRARYKFPRQSFELYPYKWYDLRWLIDYQVYFFSRSFKSDFNNTQNLNNTKSVIIRMMLFFIEAIASAIISIIISGI